MQWVYFIARQEARDAGQQALRPSTGQATIHQAALTKTLPSAAVMKLAQDYANRERQYNE